MTKPFIETQVKVVGVSDEERTFKGCGETEGVALHNAKKQARAFIRRHNLSVKQDNCEQIKPDDNEDDGLFTYLFTDLIVPERQEIEGDR